MLNSLEFYIFSFCLAFLPIFVLTPALVHISTHYNVFIDKPESRRIHRRPTPRCGGFILFFGFQLSCVICFLTPGFSQLRTFLDPAWWETYLLASLLLLLVGAIDDQITLSWPTKLIGQIAVAIYMYSTGCSVDQVLTIDLPEWMNFVATMAWFLVIINAFNLIDGLDGLATGLAIIGAFGLAAMFFILRKPADAVILTALIGACLAFLYYNFNPARIFLGDSGSMFLGFTLATISLSTGTKLTMVASLSVPLLAVGVPVFDTFLAIWRRSVRAFKHRLNPQSGLGSVVHADMDHVHHRLIRHGLTQRKVALTLYFGNILCVAVGILALVYNSRATGIYFLGCLLAIYVVVRHIARSELWDSGLLIIEGFKRPSKPVIAVVLYPFLDFVALTVSLLAVIYLTITPETRPMLRQFFFIQLSQWCVIPFVAIALSGAYSRVWSRARVSEYVFLAFALAGSYALAFGINLVEMGQHANRALVVHAILFATMSGSLILALRAAPRAIRDLLEVSIARPKANVDGGERILIYGAGLSCRLYLKKQFFEARERLHPRQIVGLIDDDPNLRKRIVHGYRVLGNGAEIPPLLVEQKAQKIVIACALSDEKRENLIRVCKAAHVKLTWWEVHEMDLLPEERIEQMAFARQA